MTELEIRKWIGLRPDDEILPGAEAWWARVTEGMAEVAPPPDGPTDEHVRVFEAFLACSGPIPRQIARRHKAQIQEQEH